MVNIWPRERKLRVMKNFTSQRGIYFSFFYFIYSFSKHIDLTVFAENRIDRIG